MVNQVTSFGRNGLSNWIVQRFTAVLLLSYLLFMVGFLFTHADLTFGDWQDLFQCTPFIIFSTATLLAIVIHAWIGLWAVSTDYLTTRMMGTKGTVFRLLFQAAYTSILFVYLVWGLKILWS